MIIGTPREAKLETLIITKEGWKHLYQYNRKRKGCSLIPEDKLETSWNRNSRYNNGGASKKTHPIADNEYRMTVDTFGISCDKAKVILKDAGLSYRQDGFIEECIYL